MMKLGKIVKWSILIILVLFSIILIIYFSLQSVPDNGYNDITCGNGICEEDEYKIKSDGGLIIYCQEDCELCDLIPPVCGNGECEVYCGIDEFESCPQDCGNGGFTTTTTTVTTSTTTTTYFNPDRTWKIKVYYVYKDSYNPKYRTIIEDGMKETNSFFMNYGDNIVWDIEIVRTDYDYPTDIFDVWQYGLYKDLNKKTNFGEEYLEHDFTMIMLEGTNAGCPTCGGGYSIKNKQPIIFSSQQYKFGYELIVHEMLHIFGCDHINYKECIMDITPTNDEWEKWICEPCLTKYRKGEFWKNCRYPWGLPWQKWC